MFYSYRASFIFEYHLPIVDELLVFDNSDGNIVLMAEKLLDSGISILDEEKFIKLKNIMKKNQRTPHQEKIVKAMDKVYDNLLAFKKRMNSDLVIMKDVKIIRIKP